MSQIRIIGGEFKGRRLQVLDEKDLRPTSDRIRENLFNWLQFSIRGKRCLDLFSGTGALGFEAMSRGAAHTTFIEKNRMVFTQIQQNIALLNLETKVSCNNQDAVHFLSKNKFEAPYDIIFLDPPFNSNLMQRVLDVLPSCDGLVHAETLLYVETDKAQQPVIETDWKLFKSNVVGQVFYALYEQVS